MKLVAKEITLASILALTVSEQDEMAKSFVRGNGKLKDVKDEQKESAKVVGKLLCALEIRLENGKKANAFAANLTLADFFKQQYGEKPQTHVLSLKNAFGAFVSTKFISETDYDVNSGNCLELAARVVFAVNGDLTHSAVRLAAAQLIERSNKEAANLREILASVKPADKMTAEEALEMVEKIFAEGHGPLAITHLPDMGSRKLKVVENGQKKFVEQVTEPVQREIYLALARAFNRLDAAIPSETTEKWSSEQDAAPAPMEIITAQTNAAEPAVA